MNSEKISIVWLRRDLRLEDNTALYQAVNHGLPILVVFIFDPEILEKLPKNDARVNFIHQNLEQINSIVKDKNGSLHIEHKRPIKAWENILSSYDVDKVFFNRDYEPYALARDKNVTEFINSQGVKIESYKDQVIFEENDILKNDGLPYTVYTPYKKKWLKSFSQELLQPVPTTQKGTFVQSLIPFPSIKDIEFEESEIKVQDFNISQLDTYDEDRNFPAKDNTSYLSPHLRFGTISIRKLIKKIYHNESFLSELIWREFFMQVLFHFPDSVQKNFKPKYDGIQWRNNEEEFEKWKKGKTGYLLVDAGMRQLNETGYMHNRVRMVVASFLIKHLLIDWTWGEAYFAEKLLDYDLSANVGNWQWAAGTGCDAAPYFRVFNPITQIDKFDKNHVYIRKWIAEYNTNYYPKPMVDHKFARERALSTYKEGLEQS